MSYITKYISSDCGTVFTHEGYGVPDCPKCPKSRHSTVMEKSQHDINQQADRDYELEIDK